MTVLDWIGVAVIAWGFLCTCALIVLVLSALRRDTLDRRDRWQPDPQAEHRAVVYQLYPTRSRQVNGQPKDAA